MKSMLSAAALAVAALCASAPASADIALTFTPSSTHINVGGGVVIDISISGLGSEILSALDINFFYTGGAAANVAGDFTNLVAELGGSASVFEFDPLTPASEVGIVAYSLMFDDDLATHQTDDAFSLGTLSFQGAFDGVTTISVGVDPDFERNFTGRNAQSLVVDIGSACIAVGTGECGQVQPAPEPATYGLAAIALLAAGVAGRRRRSAPAA